MKIKQATVMLPYLNDVYRVGEEPKYNRQFKDFKHENKVVETIETIRHGDSDEYYVVILFEGGTETHFNQNIAQLDYVEE